MILTDKQSKGLKLAVDRYLAGEKYTVIAGYAGVGKSVLIKFIIEALAQEGINPDTDVAYCCYTGKACQVLIDKGNPNAVTAHKLLYEPIPKEDGTFIFVRKKELKYKIVIVDECSMLPRPMMETLFSYQGIYVICCGDPGQLPPIYKDEDNHLLDNPHIFLDEIMRQAQDSGIIRLSMLIRKGKTIDGFKSDDALVLPRSSLNTGMLQWSDQILCATNRTRIALNQQCRDLRGFTKPIEENEKVICLANSWDTISENKNALTNGCTGTLTNIYEHSWHYPYYMRIKNNRLPLISGVFTTFEGDSFGNLNFDKQLLLTGEKYLTPRQEYQIRGNKETFFLIPHELAYGYTITTWKAQGSEWKKVLGIEEDFPFDREEHRRFLYTLITRASEKIVLVRS